MAPDGRSAKETTNASPASPIVRAAKRVFWWPQSVDWRTSMTFIEFKRRDGTRFLIDFASHWEIDDKGDKPAMWSNHEQGRNMDCADTYEQVRAKLLKKDTP